MDEVSVNGGGTSLVRDAWNWPTVWDKAEIDDLVYQYQWSPASGVRGQGHGGYAHRLTPPPPHTPPGAKYHAYPCQGEGVWVQWWYPLAGGNAMQRKGFGGQKDRKYVPLGGFLMPG